MHLLCVASIHDGRQEVREPSRLPIPLMSRVMNFVAALFYTKRRAITNKNSVLMLGAAGSEVTVTAGVLRKSGVISYFRGKVTVLDQKGLEAAACECYQIVHNESTNPR